MEQSSPVDFNLPLPSLSPTPSHSRGGRFLLVLIIIILLALIGGGIFAYTVVFEAPLTAVTRSLTTITGARSFHQDMTIKAAFKSSLAEGVISTDMEQPTTGPRRIATVVSGKSAGFTLATEIRFLDDTVYGKVTEFPLLSLIASSATNSPIGHWYSVSLKEIEQYVIKQGVDSADITKVRKQVGKFGEAGPISQIDTLIQGGVLVFDQQASLTRVNGKWGRQYTVAIDKNKLTTFITDKEKEFSLISGSLKTITFDPVVVTMGLFDYSLKSITGGIRFSDSETTTSLIGPWSVSFAITYRDINGPIMVAKPDNSASLIGYIEQSTEEAKNKAIKSQLSSFHNMAKTYYDKKKSYSNLCTKDSLVTSMLERIEKESGQKPTCRSNSKAFLVARINGISSSTTTWCADSTGYFGSVEKLPTGFKCQ